MYTVQIRYYCQDEGLLLWKTRRNNIQTFRGAIDQANVFMRRRGTLLPCDYPSEKIPCHYRVYGDDDRAEMQASNPCNVQIRKDGKLIAWRNI